MVSAVVTARILGPAAKGTLSTLLFVGAMLSYACSLGLGDAATVLAGRGQIGLDRALSTSIVATIVASTFGLGALVVVANMCDWSSITAAVVAACLLLPIASLQYLFGDFVDALELLTFNAMAAIVATAAGLVATVIFIAAFDLGVLGGVLGALTASVTGLVLLGWRLRRADVPLWAPRDRAYLWPALRMGAVMETTHLFDAGVERADLLIVYALASERDAGAYAVALTLGRLSVYVSSAIASAVFPRLANDGGSDAAFLVPKAARMAFLTALGSAGLIVVTIPFIVPVLFGHAYGGATGPAVLIALSGVAYGPQQTLARAAAALGRPQVHLVAVVVSVFVMVVVDLLLVPRFTSNGAAFGSLAASVAGLVVVVAALRSRGVRVIELFGVRRSDVSELVRAAIGMTRRGAVT
jgi:O-antigen/teichoic acid export membrane protein